MPIISIIIPVYNTGKYLSKILEDINNQFFKDYEIIVVDDGSDKETIDIENEFAKKIK